MEPLKIQCPHCNSILNVKNPDNLVGKRLQCPACQIVNAFADYKPVRMAATEQEEDTNTLKEETRLDPKEHGGKGLLVVAGVEYPLHKGISVIGRKSASSKATIQIDVAALPHEIGTTMSRAHAQIGVTQSQQGYLHTLQPMPEAKNETWVNGVSIQKGDVIRLNDGDMIRMGRVEVQFRLK